MENQELEDAEAQESFLEEMEPTISEELHPGKEMARMHRLLRKKKWRMALIYLDRLEMKYPNWSEIYLAKAVVFYATHESLQMKEALKKSCDLGNHKACEDMKILKTVHDIKLDF